MWKKALLPIVVLALGVVATVAVVRLAPEVETVEPEPVLPLIKTLELRSENRRLEVRSQGTVLPRTEADLAAEVGGTVVWASPSFEPGGFFEEGDLLLGLDSRDYEVGRASAEAQLAQARVSLAREEAEAAVALDEWRELGDGAPGALVRREPQLAEARAKVQAAEAGLQKALLDLERTEIRAPFRGRVRRKLADVGQFLSRGSPVGKIYAVDYVEIRLPVSSDEVAYLDLPLSSAAAGGFEGPPVRIMADFAGRRHEWRARIVRTEGEIDLRSRMVHLVARVEDPYDDTEVGRPSLAVGLFVEAHIQGAWADSVFEVPRSAMRSDDELLIVDDDRRLRFRRIGVLRRTESSVLVSSGLREGEVVCISALDAVVDGMQVRLEESPEQVRLEESPTQVRPEESP